MPFKCAVGDRPDSATYVRMKKKACEQVGIIDFGVVLPVDCSEARVLAEVERLNVDPRVHGILVQLPLPPQVDEALVLEAVDPRKDVDGLHPANLARLATTQTHKNATGRGGVFDPTWSSVGFSVACTPLGVVELLDRSGVELSGASVAVVGRSNMVGVPLSLLLMQRDATVTMVHSKTRDPASVCRKSDVVVVAVGRPELVRGHWIKEGAVVIDVGINSVPDLRPAKKKKTLAAGINGGRSEAATLPMGPPMRLVGDVKYDEAEAKAAMITPVPGGVGPMTIAMLLRNTLQAARRFSNARADAVPGLGPFEASGEVLRAEVEAKDRAAEDVKAAEEAKQNATSEETNGPKGAKSPENPQILVDEAALNDAGATTDGATPEGSKATGVDMGTEGAVASPAGTQVPKVTKAAYGIESAEDSGAPAGDAMAAACSGVSEDTKVP